MKILFKAMFMFCLMASPIVLTSCEKDHGTTPYDDTDDDDWKKAPTVNYDDITSSIAIPINEDR